MLLSADLVPETDLAASSQDLNNSAIVLFQEPEQCEDITIDLSAFENQTSETGNLPPATSDTQASAFDTSNLTPETNDLPIEESVSTLDVTSVDDSGSVVAQLTQTLKVANGPPKPPEMQLVDDDLSRLNGQVFILDFNGASGVSYKGPVRVDSVEWRSFELPAEYSANKCEFIDTLLTSFNEQFAPLGVTFRTAAPASSFLALEGEDSGEGEDYSTIYIGGDDSAFSQYGSFFGLAEQVDIGNQDRSDNAFVFSDKIFQTGMRADDYVSALVEIIEHEALHLLGYAHADGQTAGLSSVADETPPPPPPAPEATITVNSTADANSRDEVLTLREAILVANGALLTGELSADERNQIVGLPTAASLDLIAFNNPASDPGFNPATGVWTIRPGVDFRIVRSGFLTEIVIDIGLPEITSPVIIDGTTQPGFNPTSHMPIIEIDASRAATSDLLGSGLVITAGNSTVKGLVINRAPLDGISLLIRGGNTIVGNFIGTDVAGTVTDSYGNGDSGIEISDSADNQIGRANPGEGNLISGNSSGISILNGGSTGNRVQNNSIGTDVTGKFRLGNDIGVLISFSGDRDDEASDNLIGGSLPGQGNVISGNEFIGVDIVRGARNRVLGNLIGTSAGGTSALGNGLDGVLVKDAPDTQIGGPGVNEFNVISANRHGIAIVGSDTQRTLIQQNLIGTDLAGELDLGNREDGIFIGLVSSLSGYEELENFVTPTGSPSFTTIGGELSAGNVISGNGRDGVHIENEATKNFVLGNFIGTTRNGTGFLGNDGDGVAIIDAPENVIGARTDEAGNLDVAGNVISGNKEHGIHVKNLKPQPLLEPKGTTVVGNTIGLGIDGSTLLGNRKMGIFLEKGASDNVIGGTTDDERNIISGNGLVGVFISGDRNTVQGNYIGTDRLGLDRRGNTAGGVFVEGSNNIIGGVQLDAFNLMGGNLISGNILAFGVEIANPGHGNIIKGNFIGTDKDGKEGLLGFLGNKDGIVILNSQANTIGGETLTPGFSPGNLIAGNGRHGIIIAGGDAKDNRVQGNVIGLDNFGRQYGNSENGIKIDLGANNTIGGSTDSVRNVISANFQSGIAIVGGLRNEVAGNFIGTGKSGEAGSVLPDFGNGGAGILISESSDNRIGGVIGNDVNTRNIISGNRGAGVLILGTESTHNVLLGNYIGTDITGVHALPNKDGVYITQGASLNSIGGDFPRDGNLISGNRHVGVRIDNGAGKNKVQGNIIGGGAEPGTLVGNGEHGIVIAGSSNLIGGTSTFLAGNTISQNGSSLAQKGHGIVVESGTANRISGNSIFGNAGRGIHLGGDSFTLNDPGDAEVGANNLQDYPFVVGVEFLGSEKIIHWNLDSAPLKTYAIEFFSNSSPDPSGFGEGQTFHRSKSLTVLTDLTGTARFSQLFSSSDLFISATATDPDGNTSEFSMVDTDGDALADAWEDPALSNFGNVDFNGDGLISGFIDIDEDGNPDLELPKALPDHKDVYVEVDAMKGMAPSPDVLKLVIKAFGNAPANLVNNPDGVQGITLHMNGKNGELDDINLPVVTDIYSFDDFQSDKSLYFGTNADRPARRLVYRYALYVAQLEKNVLGVTPKSAFASEDGFMIVGGANGVQGSLNAQAANFMHELGHSLGLSHGGVSPDEINFKPNYHSIMNYIWSYPYPWAFEDQNFDGIQQPWEVDRGGILGWDQFDTAWRLDFSRRAFITLDESDLFEAIGIGGDPRQWVIYKNPGILGSGSFSPDFFITVPELGPVDWNLDGDTFDTGVEADINTAGGITQASPGQVLVGSEDWSHLKFYFTESSTFVGKKDKSIPDLGPTFELVEELSAIGDGPGFFQFRKNEIFDESAGSITVTVTRAAGTHGTVSVDFTTVDDTAQAGLDYTATFGTLTFAEGEFRKTLTVPILNDSVTEGTKSFRLMLSNPTGGATVNANDSTADVTILDDDGVQFAEASVEVDEDAGSATITVTRGSAQGQVTVNYSTQDFGATAGQDYTAVSGTLTFNPGVTSRTLTIPLLDDSIIENLESVRLVLSNPTGGASLGQLSEAFLVIRDVERGVFQFSDAAYEIDEVGGSAKITVTRTNGTDGAVTVNFAASNGTATAGSDYVTTSGTLTFAEGETTKTFTVAILDDTIPELTETVNLTLSAPTGGAVLGTLKAATVTIADDEPPTLAFSAPSFDVNENGGSATIQVVRLGVNEGTASVDFATGDGTARTGSDYVATAGTITFNRAQASKTFSVGVIDDSIGEGIKTVQLLLSNPSAGTKLGTSATATLRIIDDETVNAATFVVTNTNNSGAGSLRQAMLDANARVGTDFITFNIAGAGVKTIRPLSALPTITSPVTIDGYTQPGASVNTLSFGDNAVLPIELDGSASSQGGLFIQAGNSIVRGLVINRFSGAGVLMKLGGGNLTAGNFIGTDATGMIDLGNGEGIRIGSSTVDSGFSSNNVIGGTTPELRNVISGNFEGIHIGSDALGNPPQSRANIILGNYVGVAADGITPLGNRTGITIATADRGGDGLPGNTIGGIEPGAGNIIAFNSEGGVIVSSGYGNSIRGNSIYSNDPSPPQNVNSFRSLGISLGDANALSPLTLNDANDADTGDRFIRSSNIVVPGGNRSQNYPMLSSAIVANGAITVQGRLDSAPTTTFQIDFYANEQMDPTSYGEGKFYLGTASVTTDTLGHAEFTAVFNLSIPNVRFITATATDPGNNTSEFSARVTVGELLGSEYVVNTTDDHDDGVADALDTTLREAILAANNHPGKDTIKFNIPGSGVRTITLINALPPIMDAVTIDGYTQPGAKPNSLAVGFDGVLLIQITQAGLVVSGGNSTVRGLIINKSGLSVVGAGNNVIEGNIVGLDATGNTNVGGSIVMSNSSNNLIGGGVPAARNLLSFLQLNPGADGNRVQGNYIGTRANGLSKSSGTGGDSNIFIINSSSNNLIGGTAVGERNVLLGGPAISGGPFIEGARDLGIFTTAIGNRVLGNFIGVGADGVTPLGFTGAGITLSSDVKGTVVGGIEPGAGNIIARNGIGVLLSSGGDPNTNLPIHPESNAIRGNSIYLNSGLAIDLDGDIYRSFLDRGRDVTRNDNTDLAVGPNHLQNFPVLSSALSANGTLTIQGRLNSTPNRTFQIDFYSNEQMDPSGYGEGQTYIGTKAVTTDATGRVNFTVTLPVAVPNGRFVTATATNPDNDTSEFSARIEVGDVLGSVFIVNTTDDNDDGIADIQHTSLREAIHAANNHPGHDIILFDIPGDGVKTIAPLAPLPPITDEVTIDGYSQPGASPNTLADGNDAVLLLQLVDGNPQGFSGAHIGLDIRAGNTTIRGLAIRFLSGALFIAENGGNVIEGNFLGTDSTGTVALNSGAIEIFASSNNLIGGTTPGARNLISGSFGFIQIHGGAGPAIIPNAADFYLASKNVVQGNYIGTDKDGTKALDSQGVSVFGASNTLIGGTTAGARNVIAGAVGLGAAVIGGLATVGIPNTPANNILQGNYIGTDRTGKVALGEGGVFVGGVGNIVGGTAPGAGNLISGNNGPGIGIEGNGHVVQGNRIGTDVDGTSALGNRLGGIFITGSGHVIGGTQPGAGNLISGNSGSGIEFADSLFLGTHHAATGIRIEGNFIGTQADGITPLPNLGDGIVVTPATNLVGNNLVIVAPGATDNTIGGTTSGTSNVIAFNGGNGVNLNGGSGTAGTRIAILGNSIYSNGKLGIDLKGNGPTANDLADGDGGDNNLQNFPVLTSITNTGDSVTVAGTLNSRPSSTYRLELFDNVAFDSSGFGEGALFIGTTNVTTNSSGNASFEVTFQVAVPLTHIVTATATDSLGNTSEFSGRPPNGSFGETANLSVTKSDAPDPVLAGQLLTYTITVTNNGPDAATNVVLFDTLPTGVTFQSGTEGILGVVNKVVLGSLGTIASGATASVQIQVVPTTTGVLTNSMKVSSDQFDPDATNNTASTSTTVNPGADLVVSKSSNATEPVGVGSVVEFTLRVTNNGPSTAAAVLLTDTLPESMTFASFSGGITGAHSAGVVTWNFGNLATGAVVTVRFRATVNVVGTSTDVVQVASTTGDPDTANNIAALDITAVPSADLALTKTASPAVASVGEMLTYTITVINSGPSDAEGVILTDILPANVTFNSASVSQGSFVRVDGVVRFDLGTLPNGAEATVEIIVIPVLAGTVLSNSASVTATETLDPNSLNSQTTVETLVPPAVLFGVAEIEGGPSFLYAIDPATGAAAPIGPIGFDRISGMDFDPRTGILYATGQQSGSDPILITIDTNTGAGTAVGSILSRFTASDMSFRDSDGALFAFLVPRRALDTINIATGKATEVGTAFAAGSGNGLAFSPDGTLYHADDEHLNSLDPTTGFVTALFDLSFSPPADDFPRLNALDFDPVTGLLFGSLNDGFGGSNENYLAVVDIATGAVTIIGRTVDGLDAIAFVSTPEPLNQPPELVAIGDLTVEEGATRVIEISAADADDDSLALSATGLPPFASFVDNGDGTGILTINPDFDDAGVYAGVKITVSDGTASDEETFSITVNNVNRLLVANDDSYNVNEDGVLNVAAPQGLLSNDIDADGNSLTAVLVSNPSHGTLTVDANGSFTFTVAANYFGSDSFTYKANDGTVDSNVATVNITINAVNDAPLAQNDSAGTDEDVAVTINVLANDTDADGDTITVNAITQPTNGQVVRNDDGSLTYTPKANFYGVDTFTYTIGDGNGESSIATVTVNVFSVNDAPVMEAMFATAVINEGEAVTLQGAFSDADLADVFSLTVNWGDGVIEVFQMNDGKSFTLAHKYLDDNPTATPSDNYQVKVKVTDKDGGAAEGEFTVTVNNVAPVANLTGSNTGVRGQTLEFAGSITDVGILDTHQVTIDFGDGTIIGYHPSTDADALAPTHVYATTGNYTVKLTVRDDDGGTTTVTKQVTIKAVDLQTDPCDPTKTALVVGGTNGDDKIRFVPQGSNGEIKVLINGVSQGIFKPTGRIIAYGLGGNDDIEVAGSISLAAMLQGDGGNDRLKGGAGPSVLCGGDGDDLLIGGSGRSILIGDRGADRLIGNGGDDILIGGFTSYGCDHEALCEILETWTRRDLSYTQRINKLGTGPFALNRTTVFDDGDYDQLTGAAGEDWFFAGHNDKITDCKNCEIV